jgi:hypothetical protein
VSVAGSALPREPERHARPGSEERFGLGRTTPCRPPGLPRSIASRAVVAGMRRTSGRLRGGAGRLGSHPGWRGHDRSRLVGDGPRLPRLMTRRLLRRARTLASRAHHRRCDGGPTAPAVARSPQRATRSPAWVAARGGRADRARWPHVRRARWRSGCSATPARGHGRPGRPPATRSRVRPRGRPAADRWCGGVGVRRLLGGVVGSGRRGRAGGGQPRWWCQARWPAVRGWSAVGSAPQGSSGGRRSRARWPERGGGAAGGRWAQSRR